MYFSCVYLYLSVCELQHHFSLKTDDQHCPAAVVAQWIVSPSTCAYVPLTLYNVHVVLVGQRRQAKAKAQQKLLQIEILQSTAPPNKVYFSKSKVNGQTPYSQIRQQIKSFQLYVAAQRSSGSKTSLSEPFFELAGLGQSRAMWPLPPHLKQVLRSPSGQSRDV